MTLSLKVVDSRDTNKIIMAYVEPISAKMSLGEFKQKLCKDSDQLRKYNFWNDFAGKRGIDASRVRLTLENANGPVLADKTKPLSFYI